MITIAFAALSTGIIFSSYNLAFSRNPEEKDSLYSSSMTAFVLVETFVFMSMIVATASTILL